MSSEIKFRPGETPAPARSGHSAFDIRHSSLPRPNRDAVTTIRDDGSRLFLQPADARGRWTRARRVSAALLIAVYLLLPWIPVGGHPAVFLDVGGGHFHLFGATLAFQDAWLLFFVISGLGFGLFFVTALLGRVWCGWACPQTVFLDHLFRRVERWLEGDAVSRRRLDAAPWTATNIARRGGKQAVFLALAAVVTHLFLAYFVSLPELWRMMRSSPGEHWGAFLFVAIATSVLYFNFAWFREQLCLVICPYGRLQSVLIDDHSLVIGYDAKRGEPRGKAGTAGAGACVDCNRCVQVCPTGIDIRHGLQLECIGCAACVDACDEIMTKVERPKGLIRYDSLVGLNGGRTRWLRPRTVIYGVLLLAGAAVATAAFSAVKPANFLVYRMTGAAYFVDREDVRNQFLVRLVNKRTEPATFRVAARGLPAGVMQRGFEAPVTVAGLGEQVSPLVLIVSRRGYTGPFAFTVFMQDDKGTYELARRVEFLGPEPKLLKEEDTEK